MKGLSQIKTLAVDSTLNTVREENRTLAFVVITNNGPIKLKQGVFFSREIVFNRQVMPEPMELPHACISAVSHFPTSDKTTLYLLTPMST